MKRFFKFLGILIIVGIIAFAGTVYATAQRLKDKGDRVMAGITTWVEQKRDPAPIVMIVKDIPELMQAGDFRKGEELLDLALDRLAHPDEKDSAKPLPVEPVSDDYSEPVEAEVIGYDDQIMEPFISPDGKFLFFNNENDPATDTNIHYAERTGTLSFKYLGKLPGVNDKTLDGVPSMDNDGHFYFTTMRDYSKNMNSLYTGMFNGSGVLDVRPVAGHITPKEPGQINMDTGISPDGKTMYISRAHFKNHVPVPATSDLMIAHLAADGFEMDPASAEILKNVNTDELEYAPAISADGLRLFFTRSAGAYGLRILVATRESVHEPFGVAKLIKTINGFVEAPTLTLDGKELFFHKKIGGKLRLYRVERK